MLHWTRNIEKENLHKKKHGYQAVLTQVGNSLLTLELIYLYTF